MKTFVAGFMAMILAALCWVAMDSDLSFALKCFVVFSSVSSLFELYGWYKRKNVEKQSHA